MNIPKVKFKKMSLEENINIVSWAFYADSRILIFMIILFSVFQN